MAESLGNDAYGQMDKGEEKGTVEKTLNQGWSLHEFGILSLKLISVL